MSQADHRDTTKLSRRAALAGLSVAASPLAASAASALQRAGVDPIFAVMAEHREANLALRDACLANDLDMEECPIMARAYERQLAAELPLFTTAPTTVLGVAALLEYLASSAPDIGQDPADCGQIEGLPEFPPTIMTSAWGWTGEALAAAVRRAIMEGVILGSTPWPGTPIDAQARLRLAPTGCDLSGRCASED
jgi:hypothetical protein